MTETCKICWEPDDTGALLSPCACSGTMKYVHTACLSTWINLKNSNICDICFTCLPIPCIKTNIPLHQVEKLPLNLKCALTSIWIYSSLVLLFPFLIRHWDGNPL
jgi:E3 ubiquitin-protein ligase DOA10